MTAELLRHQSSRLYHDSSSGCIWRFLHFLDSDRHRHRKKMISYGRRFGGDQPKGGVKISPQEQNLISNDQEQLLHKEEKIQAENKASSRRKSSGAAHLIALLYKKLTKKKDRKLKNSSSAAQLLRTLSIHYLECDDYVLQDATASSEPASRSQKFFSDMGARDELRQNIPLLSRDKMLPSILSATKESWQDFVSISGIELNDGNTVSTDLKQRISMDGVLDKVPLGRKLSDDSGGEENQGGDALRSKFGSEGFLQMNSKFAHRRIQRSRSLTESLDRYSRLLDSRSVVEPPKLPQRSNSVKEQDDSAARRRMSRSRSLSESLERYSHLLESISVRETPRPPPRSNSIREPANNPARARVPRSRSMSESSDGYSQLLESVSVKEPKRQPVRLESIKEEDGSVSSSGDIQSKVLSSPLEKPDSDLTVENAAADTSASNEQNSTGNLIITTDESAQCAESASSLPIGDEQPELNEHEQTEECIVSEDRIADVRGSVPQDENRTAVEEDTGEKPKTPSPISVLDSYLEEESVSPAKYVEPQAAEPESCDLQLDVDSTLEGMEAIQEESDEEIVTTDTCDRNSFRVKEEAEFNYVKNVLKKSGFSGELEEFLTVWCSSYEPIDQLLFGEEPETLEDDPDKPHLDHLLLFDLMNEILLEVYEGTVARSTGLSRFCPCNRPMPAGDHLPDEVWAKISWLSQQNMKYTLEHAVAPDFSKSDGWMNLHWDVEGVGVELECLILDDLFDELVVDAGDF